MKGLLGSMHMYVFGRAHSCCTQLMVINNHLIKSECWDEEVGRFEIF